MHLFYTPGIEGGRHILSEEESGHCLRVLRMREGDTVYLTDGRGNMHSARIVSASPGRCVVEIFETIREYGKRPYALTMAVAPTKNNDRYEWFLEKATEIGVNRVVPVITGRSERRVFKAERGAKVITGAVKQSLKAYHPVIDGTATFDEVVKMAFQGDKFIAWCGESPGKKPLKEVAVPGRDTFILIGPEGDFSPEEVSLACSHGFTEVSLGESRLRTETAAIAACHTIALINQC